MTSSIHQDHVSGDDASYPASFWQNPARAMPIFRQSQSQSQVVNNILHATYPNLLKCSKDIISLQEGPMPN